MEGRCVFDSTVALRDDPQRQKNVVRIGCGAGFAGDRPAAALKLLHRVPGMDYLVLECLAERTFVERVEARCRGGKGYDPRISEWMNVLLPVAIEKGVCIVTNMGGVDPLGAEEEVLKLASKLGLDVSVALAYEHPLPSDGSSTYLGAAPIVHVLKRCRPHVVITSRVADVSLFLGPMIYELGWNWNSYPELAQGAVAAHLLECGCQLTGGYYVHPGDKLRRISFPELLDVSLPYADISWDGKVVLAKAEGSGGELSERTCSEQLLYEVEDPSAYVTPDLVLDIRNVSCMQLSSDKVLVCGARARCAPAMLLRLIPAFCGWKAWGEISYGGLCCEERAKLSDKLVRSWLEESFPGIGHRFLSYIIGKDSLFRSKTTAGACPEVRLRLDGLFDTEEEAIGLVREFGALYTNGPAGGGGISSGSKKEIKLEKKLVSREEVLWTTTVQGSRGKVAGDFRTDLVMDVSPEPAASLRPAPAPAPTGVSIPLYDVAHSRTGDKGDTFNFSLIPHCAEDIRRLQQLVTNEWVKNVVTAAFGIRAEGVEVYVYLVDGVKSLNVVVKNGLDGGVTCSRRIDRHGKTLSDLILTQQIIM